MKSLSMLLGMWVLLGFGLACSHPSDTQAPESSDSSQPAVFSPSPAPEIAKQRLAQNALILDVRTAGEFAEGHLAGALLMPVQEMPARLAEIQNWMEGDRSRPIVVYCRSGGRASRAAQMLHDAGYENVTNGGGLKDLQTK